MGAALTPTLPSSTRAGRLSNKEPRSDHKSSALRNPAIPHLAADLIRPPGSLASAGSA